MPTSYPKPKHVARIVFFEFTDADRKKVANQSNNAPTGGGARDLRFNYANMASALVAMFPSVSMQNRKRNGKIVPTPVHSGKLFYFDNGIRKASSMSFETPSTARGKEGRIPTLHRLNPLKNLPPNNQGWTVLIMIQLDNGEVEAHYATQQGIMSWHPDVRQPIMDCISRKRVNKRVIGFLDYSTGNEYLP